MTKDQRNKSIRTARSWMASNPVFIDTETTGLDRSAVICDLAVVDKHGERLLETLINPGVMIPGPVSAIHGIHDKDVKGAPSFGEVLPDLMNIISGRVVVIYNIEFDWRMLCQAAASVDAAFGADRDLWQCAMALYADFYGQWDPRRQACKAQKLSVAAEQCGFSIPRDLHRAAADAELTRKVVAHMAQQNVVDQETFPF